MPDKSRGITLALSLALFLTVSISLIKGGAPQWAAMVWVSLCALSLMAFLIPHLFSSTHVEDKVRSESALSYISRIRLTKNLLPIYLLVGFNGWTLLQLALLTKDKPASFEQLLISLGMMLLLALWSIAIRHTDAMRMLFFAVIATALFQSAYGQWSYLSDADKLLWMPKIYYLDRPTGTFVNANHLATYLLLAIIVFVSKIGTHLTPSHKSHSMVRAFERIYSFKMIVLIFLLTTLIMTKSIGALVSAVVVLCIALLRAILISKKALNLIAMAGMVLIIVFGITLSLDYSVIETEITGLSHTFNRRLELSKASFSMLQHHWLTGIGGGAFYSQFSEFRTLSIGNTYYNYAHNDFIQFWVEYGIIGVCLLLSFIGAALYNNLRVLGHSKQGIEATFAYASLYGTLAVAVHSLVDFPLHIPGFSVFYLVLISINSLHLHNKSLNLYANE